ncbi:unnamed protein product [Urochloa humidicola]
MGFSEALQWWEEWQLRVLILSSLFLQYFLFVTAALRKHRIPAWFRFLIWLAYLGSDAVAIYALAVFFNRHRKEEHHRSSNNLPVLWVPILLLHLGGQNGITAYNIEDNELWRRHVLTAVSQVTVTIYAFCKSWSRNNQRTLMTATFALLPGILRCLLKPLDLKRVSINSLVDSSGSEAKGEIDSLHEYIRAAVQYFQVGHGYQQSIKHQRIQILISRPFMNTVEYSNIDVEKFYGLFVDLAPAYSDRLSLVKHLSQNPDKVHRLVQCGLSRTFDRLYTKESLLNDWQQKFLKFLSLLRVAAASYIVGFISVITLYYMIRRQAVDYDQTDTNITYALLFLTLVLELAMAYVMSPDITCLSSRRKTSLGQEVAMGIWSDQVHQYNLIGYLARNKKHRNLRKLATLLVCKNFLDQLWCMKPSKSSSNITELIHGYVRAGWHQINDITTYRRFNDNRGQWTLHREGFLDSLGWSLGRPFDESVLLWHLATNLCFHSMAMDTPPSAHEAARRSTEMSNYMVYLLFVNPEMLMAGARRSLFRAAYKELKSMALDEPPLGEKEIAQNIIRRVKDKEGPSMVVHAWEIAQELINPVVQGEDKGKMWRVTQAVWVEMLCFSASRCRGYLHAKSLGKGGEYLSYVWLLLSYMGMETLAEKMQRTELQGGTNGGGIGTRNRWASRVTKLVTTLFDRHIGT